MTTEARVRLSAEDKISGVLRSVSSEFDRFGAIAGKLSVILAGVGGAGLAGAAAAVSHFAGSIDDLDEAAQGLGLTAVRLANLRAGAELAGLGAEKLDQGLSRLNSQITQAALGGKDASALFKALGIAARDSAGNVRPSSEVLGQLANRFKTLRDDSSKTALSIKLFGEEMGRKWVAYLNQGSEGLEKFAGLTDKSVEDAKRLQGQLDKLGVSLSRMKLQLGGAGAGVINSIIDKAGAQDADRQIKVLTDRFAGLQKELKYQRNPEFLQAINLELAEVEGRLNTLKQLGFDRFLSGGNAARKVDAATSAEDVLAAAAAALAKEEADKKAKTAAEALAKALEQQGAAAHSSAIMAEFADRARIRQNRAAGNQEIADEAQRKLERMGERLRELIGQDVIDRQTQDLKLLDDAWANGTIDFVQHMVGRSKALDLVNKDIEEATDAAERMGLVFTSALSDFIRDPSDGKTFLAALAQDAAQLTTQLLIMEPLMKMFRDAAKTNTSGGSTDWLGMFSSLGSSLIDSFGGARAGGGPVYAGQTYLVGERGPEWFRPQQSGAIYPNSTTNSHNVTTNNYNVRLSEATANFGAQSQNQFMARLARELNKANVRLN